MAQGREQCRREVCLLSHELGRVALCQELRAFDRDRNHARQRDAEKRGGGHARVTLSDTAATFGQPALDLLALDEALTALGALDERKARVVELRFFAGLTTKEAAEALGASETTVDDDWAMARAWLRLASAAPST